ncbi:DUF2207 domain-containing protein [Saprospiraceae bacterium]|nr:DUF2207 domain-containing protein [Saprospiraceae bacterium]
MRNFLYILLFLVTSCTTSNAQGSEYIISYHVDIDLSIDRSIEVLETITVSALGQRIKRGITRELPRTRILGDHGRQHISYEILSVKKNGEDEPYHREEGKSFETLYIGSPEVYLQKGTYEYQIKYRATDQIAFFQDFDELYWNAIGNRNVFQINAAEINVTLPERAKITQSSGYAGKSGSKNQNFTEEISANTVKYRLTKVLQPKEGFTLGIGIEKGIITAPNWREKYSVAGLLAALFTFLFGYYFYTWSRYGRDPQKPEAYASHRIPYGISPAAISYLLNERLNSAGITASIMDLVRKEHINLEVIGSSSKWAQSTNYSLRRQHLPLEDLEEEQLALMESLFVSSDHISINGVYDETVKTAYSRHQQALKDQHKGFITEGNNTKKTVLPLLVSTLGALLVAILYSVQHYNDLVPGFAIPIMIVMLAAMFITYFQLIKKPTPQKQSLQAEIAGFKEFLLMSPEEREQLEDQPDMSIDFFEELLPYAISLGVDKSWNDSFEQVFERDHYNDGSRLYFYQNYGNFGRTFGNTFATSSVQPSSSGGSGSSGGGFSGGGGGGGGVGGW